VVNYIDMAPAQGNDHSDQRAYSGDEGLVINTRLLALEREQREERQFERSHTRWLVISTALLAVFTLFLFVGGAVSNYLMIRQLNDSRRSTEAAMRSARAAEANLIQNRQATDTMLRENQDALRRTLSQNERAVKATLDQGRKQLSATLALFGLDQRPWLTTERPKLSAEPEEGKSVQVTLWYSNTGKTPALNVANLVQLYVSGVKSEPPNNYNVASDVVPTLVTVVPGDNNVSLSSVEWVLPSKSLNAYKAKTSALYVRVLVYYRDSFNTRHSSQFCAYHMSGAPLDYFPYCSYGRLMD
jgi:hypothetical protein